MIALDIAIPDAHLAEAEACGRLHFQRVGTRSVVRCAYATSPLCILTPRNHGHAAWAYLSTLGGGFVDGDQVHLEVRVEVGAAGVLSTQGETRVYRSPHGCRSELSAVVEEDGLLALLPDPTVCFAEARYRQRIDLALAPGSALILVDVLGCGRVARGERWAFGNYLSELILRQQERVVLAERVLLDPTHGAVSERFGRFNALATVLLAGEPLRTFRQAFIEKFRALPLSADAEIVESANSLGDDALLLRMAGVSIEHTLQSIRAHLDFLPSLLGDDPWKRRP